MSDLSRLLGDVYGASTPPAEDAEVTEPTTPMAAPTAADDPPAPPTEAVEAGSGPAAPGWADDDVLDEAFADWVPGPPSDAHAEERDILADVEPAESVADSIDIDAWLGAEPVDELEPIDEVDEIEAEPTQIEAAATTFDDFLPAVEPEPEIRQAAEHEGAWSRDSDDLLPRGRRTRRLSLSLRR